MDRRIYSFKRCGQKNYRKPSEVFAVYKCGTIPIPIADAIPISAVQITMVIQLGDVFDQKITEAAAKGIISAAAATLVGRTAVKLIPIIGWFVAAAIAASSTEAIGWMIANDFAKSMRGKKIEGMQWIMNEDSEDI